MRLHSDIITPSDVYVAALAAGAYVETAESHGSRTRTRAVEISLRGDSNRRPNFYNGDGSYAATWDQWGVVLAALFAQDPEMVAGSGKHPVYADAEHFHARTGGRFAQPGMPSDAHGDHNFQWTGPGREHGCTKCSATQSWDV